MEKSIPEGFLEVQQILLLHWLRKLIAYFDIALRFSPSLPKENLSSVVKEP